MKFGLQGFGGEDGMSGVGVHSQNLGYRATLQMHVIGREQIMVALTLMYSLMLVSNLQGTGIQMCLGLCLTTPV